MRVLLNTTAALEGTSGFTQTVELLTALRELPTGHEYAVLTTRAQTALRSALGDAVRHIVIDAPTSPFGRTGLLWAALPRIVRRAGTDVLYNRGNFYAPRITCAQACLIENANPFSRLDLPEPIRDRVRNRLLRAMSGAAIRYAAAAIFPSRTARDLIMNGRTAGARTFVIPHGAEMPAGVPGPPPVPGPYILAVTSLFPFKNLSLAIQAMDLLRRRGVFTGSLVIVGDQGPPFYRHALEKEIGLLHLESVVRMVPAVPRTTLPGWYRHAAIALTTSLEETFGLPVVEAMALGAPVVAPASPSRGGQYFLPFTELCGGAAEYFDPFDAGSCAASLERALDQTRRAAMVAAGLARAREFTWRAAAERTAAMFNVLAASRNCSDNATNGTRGKAS
jgi:glycosyltransferase involved in cell wall biosynthesis